MSGVPELIFAILGPLVAIVVDWLTVGSDKTFVEQGCKRVVSDYNQGVAEDKKLPDACAVLVVRSSQSSIAAVNLLPSLVAGVTSVYGTVFGLLQGDGQAQAIMMAITVLVILMMSLRPLYYLMNYSLYNLHDHVIEWIPRRHRGDPNYTAPTYLQVVQRVPRRINIALIVLALGAFLWRTLDQIIDMLTIPGLLNAVCGC